MKTIRKNTFETNSSSAHVITFSTKGSAADAEGYILNVVGGSWQWDKESFSDPQSKFSYWLNAFDEEAYLLLRTAMKQRRNTDYFYISERVGETSGPVDKDIYESIQAQVIGKLEAVFNYFKDNGVILNIIEEETLDQLSIEEYIHYLRSYNDPENPECLTRSFRFLVDLDLGIDHQSAPAEDCDCAKLAEFPPEDVFDWVFGDGSFETGNDNDYDWDEY